MSDERIPAPEVSANDVIAQTRALDLPDLGSIPQPTTGYKPATASDKSYLRRISDKLQAEAIQALEECANKGPKLAEDVGKHAPTADFMNKLRNQKKQLITLKAKLAALDQFIQEKDDILNHDIAIALDKVGKELAHQIDTNAPELATEYPETLGYNKAHGDSVREGREKAKQKKEEK